MKRFILIFFVISFSLWLIPRVNILLAGEIFSLQFLNHWICILALGENSWSWKSTFWDRDNKIYNIGCTGKCVIIFVCFCTKAFIVMIICNLSHNFVLMTELIWWIVHYIWILFSTLGVSHVTIGPFFIGLDPYIGSEELCANYGFLLCFYFLFDDYSVFLWDCVYIGSQELCAKYDQWCFSSWYWSTCKFFVSSMFYWFYKQTYVKSYCFLCQ